MIRNISELVKIYSSSAPVHKGKVDPTIEKIIPIGNQLIGKSVQPLLERRQVSPLSDVDNLAEKVLHLQSHFDELTPDEVDQKLSELEAKISLFTDEEKSSEKFQKIENMFQKCLFEKDFPIVGEFKNELDFSFIRAIGKTADQTLKSQTFDSFRELNQMQQWEIIRYARGEG